MSRKLPRISGLGSFSNFSAILSYFWGRPKPIFFLFFSYFGPEARKPRSSRRAGSQLLSVYSSSDFAPNPDTELCEHRIFQTSRTEKRGVLSGVAPANQTKKSQFINFSQGHSGTKVQCEPCLFSQGKTPEFTKMGEIHELFFLALFLVWFAGATPDFRRGVFAKRAPLLAVVLCVPHALLGPISWGVLVFLGVTLDSVETGSLC